MAAGGFESKVYFGETDSKGQIISSQNFMSRLSSGLNDLRAQGKFCDVFITVENKKFPAHKVVLSAASDYFLAMFTSGFQESTSSEVSIEGESESFAQLLNFAYTGSLNLSTETIRGVFQMACFMQTSEAIEICSCFLAEFFTYPKASIGYDDIFLLWQLFDGQGMKKLAKACRKYMLQNFTGFSSSDAFLIYMTHHQMVEILEDEEIETELSSETQILQAVIRWLKYDWDARKAHAELILQKVRLGLVRMERLQELFDPQILDIPQCKRLLEEVIKLRGTQGVSNVDLMRNYPAIFASRGTVTTLIALGNKNGRKSIWYFDQSIRTWLAAMNFPFPSCGVLPGCRLIDVDGELCVCGGKAEDGEPRPYLHRYDPESNEWEVLPNMKYPKANHAMVALDGSIYTVACDGYYTERFNIKDREWEELSPLPNVNSAEHSVVAFCGKLLAAEIETETGLSSIKVYNPSCDRWHVQEENLEFIPAVLRALYVQDGICYQVVHTRNDCNDLIMCRINHLVCNFDDEDQPIVTVGDEVDQSQIPRNSCGAFCINGHVFVKLYGYIHKTDITVNDGHLEEPDFRLWNDITQLTTGAAISNYTFDRHRLHPAYTA